jgi:poly(hydroxyalkanoate) depolymerase family esterase
MERSSRANRRARATLVACLTILTLICLGHEPRAAHAAGGGEVHDLEYGSGVDSYPYKVYTPSTYHRGDPVPLLVATHGCMTTADEFMHATLYNQVAEREGFVVAYVDVDPATAALPQPLRNCWRFYDDTTWHRGQGHAGAVAGMTRAVMKRFSIDPQRVYMAGASAGGFMTSAMSAAYPDLFAAVAVLAGGAYDDGFCFFAGEGLTSVEESARLAREEMGSRARIVPRMVMGGDADLAITPECADKAFFQALRTSNLVIGDSQTSPISLEASSTRLVANPGGYDSTVSTYRDPAGCLIGERWLIHGMGHFWPGGPSDPEWANWTDPKGPSGAEATWAFFRRYTKSSTAMPCAEVRSGRVAKRCRKRRVKVSLPAGSKRVRASVNNRRVRNKVTGRRVKIWLPAGKRSRTVIRVTGRRKSGRKFTRRYVFKGCGPHFGSGRAKAAVQS